jgi:hypothetical protein
LKITSKIKLKMLFVLSTSPCVHANITKNVLHATLIFLYYPARMHLPNTWHVAAAATLARTGSPTAFHFSLFIWLWFIALLSLPVSCHRPTLKCSSCHRPHHTAGGGTHLVTYCLFQLLLSCQISSLLSHCVCP